MILAVLDTVAEDVFICPGGQLGNDSFCLMPKVPNGTIREDERSTSGEW